VEGRLRRRRAPRKIGVAMFDGVVLPCPFLDQVSRLREWRRLAIAATLRDESALPAPGRSAFAGEAEAMSMKAARRQDTFGRAGAAGTQGGASGPRAFPSIRLRGELSGSAGLPGPLRGCGRSRPLSRSRFTLGPAGGRGGTSRTGVGGPPLLSHHRVSKGVCVRGQDPPPPAPPPRVRPQHVSTCCGNYRTTGWGTPGGD